MDYFSAPIADMSLKGTIKINLNRAGDDDEGGTAKPAPARSNAPQSLFALAPPPDKVYAKEKKKVEPVAIKKKTKQTADEEFSGFDDLSGFDNLSMGGGNSSSKAKTGGGSKADKDDPFGDDDSNGMSSMDGYGGIGGFSSIGGDNNDGSSQKKDKKTKAKKQVDSDDDDDIFGAFQ